MTSRPSHFHVQPNESLPSPLFPDLASPRIFSWIGTEIRQRWQKNFNIDIGPDWNEHFAIDCYECPKSGLRFFSPPESAGTHELYSGLEKFSWYYLPDKWEYDMALRDIPPASKVLEVGSGEGAFVKKLLERGIDAQGIELNPVAAGRAQAAGLPVAERLLSTIEPSSFDVICHFQVLEHISDIKNFLLECLRSLRPGGRLIFAIPNMSGFLGRIHDNILNMPPHHMSQWRIGTTQSLQSVLPLRLVRILQEPLADYHLEWYADLQARRLYQQKVPARLGMAFHQLLRTLLRSPHVRGFVRGHSQYAYFQKL